MKPTILWRNWFPYSKLIPFRLQRSDYRIIVSDNRLNNKNDDEILPIENISPFYSSIWNSRNYVCRSRFNLRMVRLFIAVFFFIFFVIQFKSGPFTMPTHYVSHIPNNSLSTINQSRLMTIMPVMPLLNITIMDYNRFRNETNNQNNITSFQYRPFNQSQSMNKLNVTSIHNLTNPVDSAPTTALIESSNNDIIINDNVTNNQLFTDKTVSNHTLRSCPVVPPNLVGEVKILTNSPPMEELERLLPDVEIGGRYRPKMCQSKDRVAIIIPFRQRMEHLRTFLLNLHPMLMRQNIDYGIYVIEQAGNGRFNRAKLMNIGFIESLKQYHYDCFIFHDVDLIPEDDRNLYTCPENPRHMSVAIDKFRYRLPYKDIFGGVSALTRQQFEKVNGFSNEFWGWGGEDDDMSNRIRHYHYTISRYPAHIARYKMLKHSQDAPNADRYKKLYNGWKRFKSDGINSIKYKVLDTSFKKLYTWIEVDVFPPKAKKKRHQF